MTYGIWLWLAIPTIIYVVILWGWLRANGFMDKDENNDRH